METLVTAKTLTVGDISEMSVEELCPEFEWLEQETKGKGKLQL